MGRRLRDAENLRDYQQVIELWHTYGAYYQWDMIEELWQLADQSETRERPELSLEVHRLGVRMCDASREKPLESAEVNRRLGHALARAGHWTEATACFRKSLEILAETKPSSGQVSWKQDIEEAARNWLNYFGQEYSNQSWALATAADPAERDPAQAVELAQLAVDLNPGGWNNWNNLGVAQYRAGNWQAAVEALEKADRMIPGGDREHRMFLAMAHWPLGDKDNARARYAQGAAWIAVHGKGSEEQGRFRAEAEQLLEISAEDRQRLVEAHLARQVADQPDVTQVWIDRAQWHQQQGAHEQAIADARRAVEIEPTSTHAWLMVLDSEFARGSSTQQTQAVVAEAEAALGQAGAPQIMFPYAAWNLWTHRQAEYEQTCRDAAARFAESTEPGALYLLARAAALTSQPVLKTEQLVEMASRAVDADPNPWFRHTLALCLLRDGQEDAAIAGFHQSLGQGWGGAPLNWLGLAIAHASERNQTAAQEWLQKAHEWLQHNPLGLSSELHPHDRIECQLLLREAQQLVPIRSSAENDGNQKTP